MWLVLVHEKHGRTHRDRQEYNSGYPRMLNIVGRWSTRPTPEVPILVWTDREAAEACLAICQKHRGPGVVISSVGGNLWELGKHLVRYGPAHEPALAGYLPYGAAAAAKAESARKKVLAAAAYLVGSASGQTALVERARELSPEAGSGAVDYLTGKTGAPIAKAIVAGTIAADDVVQPEHVADGLRLANAALAARLQAQGSRFNPY